MASNERSKWHAAYARKYPTHPKTTKSPRSDARAKSLLLMEQSCQPEGGEREDAGGIDAVQSHAG